MRATTTFTARTEINFARRALEVGGATVKRLEAANPDAHDGYGLQALVAAMAGVARTPRNTTCVRKVAGRC